MGKVPFNKPKKVLVFNSTYRLIAMFVSIRAAANHAGCHAQAISLACLGDSISSMCHYYRHYNDNRPVTFDDIGKLKLQDFDKLCNASRKLASKQMMERRKHILMEKKKNQE